MSEKCNFAPVNNIGPVVQLDRMTDSGSVGWEFESPRVHKKCLRFKIEMKFNCNQPYHFHPHPKKLPIYNSVSQPSFITQKPEKGSFSKII